jgi:hypothetical protein
MFVAAITTSLVFDLFKPNTKKTYKKYSRKIKIATLLSSLSLFIYSQPSPYRYQDEELLKRLSNIIYENEISQIPVLTDLEYAALVSDRLVINSFGDNTLTKNKYIVLNMSKVLPNPYLSNLKRYEDENLAKFYSSYRLIVEDRIQKNTLIAEEALRTGFFKILFKNSTMIILENEEF